MKNLCIALSCFTAIILTASCTADSPVETKTENMITPIKIIEPGTGVYLTDLDNPIPPKK